MIRAVIAKKNVFDLPLVLITAALIIFGLIIIYDATPVAALRDFGDKLYYFKNQLTWATLGSFALLFLAFFDYHKLIRMSPVFLAICTLFLLAVLIPGIGTKVYGARRWINFAGFTFQPSEITKVALVLYETAIISKFEKFKISIKDAAVVIFLPAVFVAGLVLIQPDLGTALIFLAILITVYFIGGSPLKHFLVSIPPLILGALLLIIIEPYRFSRIKSFIDPTHDPQGASYQIYQILLAIVSGGFLGVGVGGAKSKFDFIPEIQGDAIFAIIVEEFGFLGAVLLIVAFLYLIQRGIKIARNAKDFQGKVLAGGLIALIAIQSLFNIASVVALVPLTGIPMPFISYGGSSLFVTMASIGILLNIKKQSS